MISKMRDTRNGSAVQLRREEIRTPQRLSELHGPGVEDYRTARERDEAGRDRATDRRLSAGDLRGYDPRLPQGWLEQHEGPDAVGRRERFGRASSARYAGEHAR